jgi:broad specificity phosphatase PhoE
MTTLFIARHGNTFEPHEKPTRVGKLTDLSLVQKGLEQAQYLTQYFITNNIQLNNVFLSFLKRVMQTAEPILNHQQIQGKILDFLVEIDYGVDENQIEEVVITRLGQQAIDDWNHFAILPQGWFLDIDATILGWKNIAKETQLDNATNLVVSSNGILRFAPQILENPNQILDLKIAPGCLSAFDYDETKQKWSCRFWNEKPENLI